MVCSTTLTVFGRLLAGLVATTALLGLASPAAAGPLDLHLASFYDPNAAPADRIENASYSKLLREIGLALGPRMAGPAASLGPLGIEAAYEPSFTEVHADAEYWQRAADEPESTLTTSHFRVRKGLPGSMQIGTVLTHLHGSNLWAIGAEINASLVDGFRNIPDLSVRASINGLLGNRDIEMLIAGGDVALSKSFGVAGVLAIQPWAAYSLGLTYAATHQIPVFPNDKAIKPEMAVFKQVTELSHRAAFGARIVVTRVQLGFELARSFTDDLNVVTGRVGVSF